jgi:mannose-6-phosphate isomerase-like protein (cupin superfamily)
MKSNDVQAVLATISEEEATLARGDPSRIFAELNECAVGAVRFSGKPPWERHPAGDELLHVLEGELAVTLLAPEGRIEVMLRPGSVFVVPRGLWHRSDPHGAVSMLFVTPTRGGEESSADDPRETPSAVARGRGAVHIWSRFARICPRTSSRRRTWRRAWGCSARLFLRSSHAFR